MATQDHQRDQQEVAGIALSLRIPPFWRDTPRLWFCRFESVTADQKKGKRQLAEMIIAQLSKPELEQVCDIIYEPPQDDAEFYNALKSRLISVYEESDERQLNKLLSEVELGDRTPSQLLRHMKILGRGKLSEPVLRHLWRKNLPPTVRSAIAISENIDKSAKLEDLAKLADSVLQQSPEVAAVSSTPASQQPQEKTSDQILIEEVRKLSMEVAALKQERTHQSTHGYYQRSSQRSPARQPYRQPSRSPTRPHSPHRPTCYYHRRFGERARRCTSPCSFTTTKSEN